MYGPVVRVERREMEGASDCLGSLVNACHFLFAPGLSTSFAACLFPASSILNIAQDHAAADHGMVWTNPLLCQLWIFFIERFNTSPSWR